MLEERFLGGFIARAGAGVGMANTRTALTIN
jgi:hypothetical protein